MKLYIKSGGVRDNVSVEEDETPEPVDTGEGEETKEKKEEPKPKEIKEVEEVDFEEIEEFEILGEDEVTETVLDLLKEGMTKDALIEQSGLDEIDVELALRELLDEKKIKKEDNIYTKV